jgi:YVTN family beta-propeller protein
VALSVCAAGAKARNVYFSTEHPEAVSVIQGQTNQLIGSPIAVGKLPVDLAVAPDGKTAYVVNLGEGTVTAIDTQTNQAVGSIPVGANPAGIAITPDGRTAYVTGQAFDKVFVVDLQSRSVVKELDVGDEPQKAAITPDGKTAYVTDFKSNSVSVISTEENKVVATLPVGEEPEGIAITPDGAKAYVANFKSDSVSVVDVATDTVALASIQFPAGAGPQAIAISPDGGTAYVTDHGSKAVSMIDVATDQLESSTIGVGELPEGIAVTPDGRTAYVAVASFVSPHIAVIDTRAKSVSSTIGVGQGPFAVAVVPVDLPPVASMSVPRTIRLGAKVRFDASASHDVDGSVAGVAWNFGDGTKASGPTASHAFGRIGTHDVTATATDNEGCSTSQILSGKTVACYGSPLAKMTQAVRVVYPGVRVKCPRAARPRGCRFTLQGLTQKGHGKVETAVTKLHVKAGKTAIARLRPRRSYISKLGNGKIVLVKLTLAFNGSAGTTFRRLLIR